MLTWSSWNATLFENSPQNHTLTALTNLRTLQSTLMDITNLAHDMFCPGSY